MLSALGEAMPSAEHLEIPPSFKKNTLDPKLYTSMYGPHNYHKRQQINI
jgi:hypothetical protein